jgi:fumarate hydratase, class II
MQGRFKENTMRTETDGFGSIDIPANALWGAQTARSLHFFAIGTQRMPLEIIHALALIKWAAAKANMDLDLLEKSKGNAIADAALRIAHGVYDSAFPLSVWQTGSGTQSNMNVNEVIAKIASAHVLVHPNDDVNLGQSSNDVFPTAMHLAALVHVHQTLQPALRSLHQALLHKS